MNKKILVFGGGGFMGGYVTNELINRGYKVVIADLFSPKYLSDFDFIKCDVLNPDEVKAIFNSISFDIVYNFAALANLEDANNNPTKTFSINVLGNINILEACIQNSIKHFVFASSAYAVSSKGSFYGISKLTSEKLIEEYSSKFNLNFTIIRYGSLYSEQNHHNNYIYNLIKEALITKTIDHKGVGQEIRE